MIFTARCLLGFLVTVTAESITTTTMQFMTRAVSKLTPSVTPSVTPTGAPDLAIPLWMIIVIAVVFGVTVLFALVWWCLVRLKHLIRALSMLSVSSLFRFA